MSPAQLVGVVVVAALIVLAYFEGKWVAERNELRRQLQERADIPKGMVRVAVPGRAPVCVPVNVEEVEAVQHIVDIAKGDSA